MRSPMHQGEAVPRAEAPVVGISCGLSTRTPRLSALPHRGALLGDAEVDTATRWGIDSQSFHSPHHRRAYWASPLVCASLILPDS